MISLIAKDGHYYSCQDQTCFGFMKCDELYTRQIGRFGVSVPSINGIAYTPNLNVYTQEYKDMVYEYLHNLMDEDHMSQYSYCYDKRTATISLPLSRLSGTEMVAIFSLFRYTERYPSVVVDTVKMVRDGIDFDRALYMAHFLELTEDLGVYVNGTLEWTHYVKPSNHSVVPPTEMKIGGHEFLSTGLHRAHVLPAFSKTHSYGNIQGIVGGCTGRPITFTAIASSEYARKLAYHL